MCRSVALLALALVLAACSGEEAVDGLVPDPVPDPVLDQAVRVWRQGADALEPGREAEDPAERVVRTWQEGDLVIEEVETVEDPDPAPFTVLDEGAARFLRVPSLDAAVRFSCGSVNREGEWRITKAMQEGSSETRLLALTILMKVRAPRSVAGQWEALQDARRLTGHPELPWLLAELERAFSWDAVEASIGRDPPEKEYDVDHALEWGLRAAGVVRHWEAVPRLRALTRSENLHTSLTAERSLEDFPGPQADEALGHCVLGWRYNAYERAAKALLHRNPLLLERTLLENTAPRDARYQQGVFLGRLGNSAAVPILCETLPRYQIIDREMFDQVEALATVEHWALVDALPEQVRDNQRARADQVRENVGARLGLSGDDER